MKKFITTLAGAILSTSTALLVNAQDNCTDGVHMIIARGSGEDPGPGRLSGLASEVQDAIEGSTIEPLDYIATIQDYQNSVKDGVESLTDVLTDYATTCPDSKVVLMGFSQGAQVALHTLCGGYPSSNTVFNFVNSEPFNSTIVDRNVIAVILYGSPNHAASHPWNEGNSTNDGHFALTNITACESYAPKIRAWCDTGDTYCDRGDIRAVHSGYFEKYDDDALEFIVERYEDADRPNGNNTTTSSAAPSGTSSVSGTASAPTTSETGGSGSGSGSGTRTSDAEGTEETGDGNFAEGMRASFEFTVAVAVVAGYLVM